jgi:hypothetical protein
LTVREFCYNSSTGALPDWWLPCYDLSTEFHLFARDFQRRSASNRSLLREIQEKEGEGLVDENKKTKIPFLTNQWFIKPCGGTRGLGHRILTSENTNNSNTISGEVEEEEDVKKDTGLHYASILAPLLSSQQIATLLDLEKEQQEDSKQFEEEILSNKVLECSYLEYDHRDRVAQLLVEYPLLMKNRKFDMRFYVFVRSFYPFEGKL